MLIEIKIKNKRKHKRKCEKKVIVKHCLISSYQ
jgi:hypothetical protein